jgi:hypothetical protein
MVTRIPTTTITTISSTKEKALADRGILISNLFRGKSG